MKRSGIARRPVATFAAAGALLLAACSGGGDADTTTSPVPTNPSTTVVVDVTETPTTEPAPALPDVLAGVNWLRDASPVEPDAAAPLPSFDEVTATAGVPAAPPGYPFRESTYTLERWDVAGVTFVSGGCGCWEGGNSGGVFGGIANPQYLFRSDDGGVNWSQVDLSGSLTGGNGFVEDIAEFDGALVLQATDSDGSRSHPSVIVVARSVDGGVTWAPTATLTGEYDGRMSLFGQWFGTAGPNLVLVGADVACDFDGSEAIQSIGTVFRPRLWTSTDGGTTWAAQSREDTALEGMNPAPADPSGCDGLDLNQQHLQFEVRPRAISFAAGSVYVWSQDGTRIASSADGLSWSTATLDGAAPVPVDSVDSTVNSQAATIAAVGDGLVALNVERRRTSADEATGSGDAVSVVGWASPDGATWTRLPSGRPLAIGPGARFDFFITADGLGLSEHDVVGGELQPGRSWASVAGPQEDWAVCQAAAGANCAFSEEVVGVTPGADLSGIDLHRVALSGVDLSGVSLVGADLSQSGVYDCVLDGTDFSDADLSGASLYSEAGGAVFAGADLSGAYVQGSLFGADLSTATLTRLRVSLEGSPLPAGTGFTGQDLSGWAFSSYTGVADLTGVDFSGANLSGASFGGVDLTGADFTGATLADVRFSTSTDPAVTCPDGLPVDATQPGPAACRLGA